MRTVLILAVLALAGPASAELLRCGDAKGGDKPGICGQFEQAPKASPDDPNVKRALAVWDKVRTPFAALTGRDTGINVLAPEARYTSGGAKKAFPPAAYICPGGPPIVYVPYTLLDLVYEKKAYPEDFLAFVFGHELGHRMNDITIDGCQLAAFQRPGKGRHEEELADNRGAFFAAVGGYSTRSIAREDLVSKFLQAEFHVGRTGVEARKDALMGALEHFDAYENLYEVALALTFGGELQAATRLLGWADELIEGRGVPLPELKVVRALVLTMSVASRAPAWSKAGYDPAVSALRCKPVFPTHTALWEEPRRRRVRAGAADPAEVLRQASRLLDEAAALGAHDLVVASGQACIAIYQDRPEEAKRHLAAARRAAPKSKAVQGALAANAALADFVGFLDKNPMPRATEEKEARKWAGALKKAARAFEPSPDLVAFVEWHKAYPKLPPLKRDAAPVCKAEGAAKFELSRPPEMPEAIGSCPSGWKLLHSVPTADAATASGSAAGVTNCAPADGGATRLVKIRLPGSMRPSMDEVELTVRLIDAPSKGASFEDWSCACSKLEERGASDLGSRAWAVRCPKAGASAGVIFVAPNGRVTRAATFHL